MARKPVIGECRLCGTVTRLSFEHVPPRSAFNDNPIVDPDVKKLIGSDTENPFEILVPFGRDADDARAAVALDPAARDIELEQRIP